MHYNRSKNNSFLFSSIAIILLQANSLALAECTFFTSFSDNKDGTVTNTRNGLIWKRCAEGSDYGNGICTGSGTKVNWKSSKLIAQGNRFLNKSDWRLPSKEEFEEVLGTYDECQNNPEGEYAASKAIALAGGIFWSSSSDVDKPNLAWTVNFDFGTPYRDNISNSYYVRLVRNGNMLGGKATLEFSNELRDKVTKLAHQNDLEVARQGQEVKDRERKVAAFRKSLKEGDETTDGMVIEVKGNLIKIQTTYAKCTVTGFNGCLKSKDIYEEKWVKRSEIFPQ